MKILQTGNTPTVSLRGSCGRCLCVIECFDSEAEIPPPGHSCNFDAYIRCPYCRLAWIGLDIPKKRRKRQ